MFSSANYSGMFTDFYELSMIQGYFLAEMHRKQANFDYFFRRNPFGGGFTVFAGLETLTEALDEFRFSDTDLEYLKSQGFKKEFINYLSEFSFQADVFSVNEGEVVFPNEPVLRISGNLAEAQLVESLVLNILNFQSLIATKAARIKLAASGKLLADFGMRRAQGLGAIHATRAAAIGGVLTTSNVYSAKIFNLEASGTMAHSWVQSFDSELEAFRTFAKYYPDSAILLVDTYNTLDSGVPNAITVAKELEQKGKQLKGIRLDSGDLAKLSKKARAMLNAENLGYVKIVLSNQLDEYLIRSLLLQNAPVDFFGVGTSLATGAPDASLDGVYKLSRLDNENRMKISDNVSKTTLPGIKQIVRHTQNNQFVKDTIELENKRQNGLAENDELLLKKVITQGKLLRKPTGIFPISEYCASRLAQLPDEHKRFENPQLYPVIVDDELNKVKMKLTENYESFTYS